MDRETKRTVIQMASLSGIGIAMVFAVFGCFFLGRWLDAQLGTDPYVSLLFLLIGVAAGFRNMYVLIRGYLRNDKPLDTQDNREPQRKRPPPKEA